MSPLTTLTEYYIVSGRVGYKARRGVVNAAVAELLQYLSKTRCYEFEA